MIRLIEDRRDRDILQPPAKDGEKKANAKKQIARPGRSPVASGREVSEAELAKKS